MGDTFDGLAGHALFPKLAQPSADGAVRKPERVRLFFRLRQQEYVWQE
jgi:hypothetical protein